MRNLKRISHGRLEIQTELPLAATTWDTANQSLIAALGPSEDNQVIEIRRLDESVGLSTSQWPLLASWDAPCPIPDLACDRILSFHCLSHSGTLCLVLAGGDIIIVREQPLPGQDKIEIVGSVDVGVSAATWSPDDEILAVTTQANTLLYMSAEFDNIASVTFSPEDAKLSKQVSVGWGKAETQFKGKRAKALRDPTIPEKVDLGTLAPSDDKSTTISWRGDGAYLAVNSVEDNSRRMIRIFSREGALDSVSEAVDGMLGALSWKPSGQLLASVQHTHEGVQVIFFERNGLRHGEFSLRLSPREASQWGRSISLAWSSDSTTLAVSFTDRVQLWTMGNYHYYLKQKIVFGTESGAALPLLWHPEDALRLAVSYPLMSSAGDEDETLVEGAGRNSSLYAIETMKHVFDVNAGINAPPNDYGVVAVVDGRLARVTPMRVANVPPPMALHEVDLPETAVDVAFNATGRRMAVLHDSTVTLWDSGDNGAKTEPYLKTTFHLPVSGSRVAQQICVRGEEDIYVLIANVQNGTCLIHHAPSNLSFPVETSDSIRIFTSVDYQSLCLAQGNAVFDVEVEVTGDADIGLSRDLSPIAKFPALTPWVQVTKVNDSDIAFGLTPNGSIYANERLLAKNCTSFAVTNDHLLFTTSNHLLKFAHLTNVESLEVPADEPETDERCRSVERGAKIVTVMPSNFSVVLQMPRGNLETIYPRALVLAHIRSNINKGDYKAAFMTCRVQRVDMNILHDHAPAALLSNVGLFIDQLGRADHIDLFLSQLSEENVAQTMYRETLQTPVSAQDESDAEKEAAFLTGPEKINRICEAFLTAFASQSEPNMQNTITANLCKSPPDIEAGLSIIASIPELEQDRIEAAVEHICFLADVNQIYDRALGIYDLRLALLVAQQSQKDPREYLPYLQRLQDMPDLQRKFSIDDDLGRHAKALAHIKAMGDLDQVKAYTEKHALYSEALELYRYEAGHQAQILQNYAAYLNARNRYHEAAVAYESLADYRAASIAYRNANSWREALACATLIPLDPSEIADLATALADDLVEAKNFASAGVIYADYLADLPTAARNYCRAYHFSEAFRLIGLARKPDLLAQVVDPGIAEGAGTLTELMADCRAQLLAQVPRLRELRAIKKRDPLAFYEGAANEDIPDNISVAPSAVSTTAGTFMTRYTGAGTGTVATNATRKTSKNKRREERKRARGKKGSIYEEEYLVSSVGRLIERVNSVGEDVRNTVDACLRRSMREQARALEEAAAGVIDECKRVIREVYEVEEAKPAAADGEGAERPPGADGVVWDSLEERRKRVPPAVKELERNKLL